MQMYGKFERFPFNSVLFGFVIVTVYCLGW